MINKNTWINEKWTNQTATTTSSTTKTQVLTKSLAGLDHKFLAPRSFTGGFWKVSGGKTIFHDPLAILEGYLEVQDTY